MAFHFISQKSNTISIPFLLVAGGGGSVNTSQNGTGGAGAGGALTGIANIPLNTPIKITVGAGGAPGSNGNNSIFYNLTAIGGGRSGNYQGTGSTGPQTGGCGAGASRDQGARGAIGIQGGDGGANLLTSYGSSGGGGGMGGSGYAGANDNVLITTYSLPYPSTGGIGIINPLSGSKLGELSANKYWVAGGGGGIFFNFATVDTVNFPVGGLGGGGKGCSGDPNNTATAGSNGLVNTGGGAGTGSRVNFYSGGSGGIALQIPSSYNVNFSNGVSYNLDSIIPNYKVYKIIATSTTSETLTIT